MLNLYHKLFNYFLTKQRFTGDNRAHALKCNICYNIVAYATLFAAYCLIVTAYANKNNFEPFGTPYFKFKTYPSSVI